ncbi:MAG: hypothetical protein QY316_00720 [Thermodesulfobacteriota bacterium]|nr:MAG: hypothetical protein QY316_00720 [Thermodesulfobacteriota bacterium]
MKRLFACLFAGVLLSSCAAVTPVFMPLEHKKSTSFQLGEIQEASLGDAMVVEEDIFFYEGMVASDDFQPPAQLGSPAYPMIPKGSAFKIYGKLQNGTTLYKEPMKLVSRDGVWSYCLAVNKVNQVYGDTACEIGLIRDWKLPETPFKLSKVYEKGSFKSELLYNGKSGDTIKVSYREYKDDLARPSFYQDISYDLSESTEIGFKKMKIEVLKATNSSIEYIVKSPMN